MTIVASGLLRPNAVNRMGLGLTVERLFTVGRNGGAKDRNGGAGSMVITAGTSVPTSDHHVVISHPISIILSIQSCGR